VRLRGLSELIIDETEANFQNFHAQELPFNHLPETIDDQ
jgi:hypothetical protein